jgi:hypothetical protein
MSNRDAEATMLDKLDGWLEDDGKDYCYDRMSNGDPKGTRLGKSAGVFEGFKVDCFNWIIASMVV